MVFKESSVKMLINSNLWVDFLVENLQNNNFKNLENFLVEEKNKHYKIFPKEEAIFNAFNSTPFNDIKVIIIGQDPYHSFEIRNNKVIPHAHGLSFSVPKEAKKIPPSLKNIFKELHNDLGYEIPAHGNLTHWAKQGVLLLNATLTVRAHQAGSHQNKGWEIFTNFVINKLSSTKTHLVFLLWGKFAQQKINLINSKKHCILEAAHPSPFSAHRGFLECKHFSKTNLYLTKMGKTKIDWKIQ